MDCVYICRPDDNEELRYSIRSVIANLPHDNIWVVGEKPDWYGGNFIHVPAQMGRYTNVFNNLTAIINSPDISDDFIFMNDDFFINKKIDSIEYFYNESLQQRHDDYVRTNIIAGDYAKRIKKTIDFLKQSGIEEPVNYEVHMPMVINKDKLSNILRNDILFRSTYGNIYSVGGNNHKDVKVYFGGPMDEFTFDIDAEDFEFFSSDDKSFYFLYERVSKSFPIPSSYELDRQWHN